MKSILSCLGAVFFLLTGLAGWSQKNNPAMGFVVLLNKDTIACGFESFNQKKQPKKITVIINGENKTFSPADISGFMSPSNSLYATKKIELFRYNRDIQTAVSGDIPESVIKPAEFLKILHRGKINLYQYRDELNNEHFFIENEKEIKEIYTHLYSSTGGFATVTGVSSARKPVVVNNFQYYYGLKDMMQDCKEIFPVIDQTGLNEKSLKSLMKQYDKCKPFSGN